MSQHDTALIGQHDLPVCNLQKQGVPKENGRDFDHDRFLEDYAHDMCSMLAFWLHDNYGLKIGAIRAIDQNDPDDVDYQTVVHQYVYLPNGLILDARGIDTEKAMLDYYRETSLFDDEDWDFMIDEAYSHDPSRKAHRHYDEHDEKFNDFMTVLMMAVKQQRSLAQESSMANEQDNTVNTSLEARRQEKALSNLIREAETKADGFVNDFMSEELPQYRQQGLLNALEQIAQFEQIYDQSEITQYKRVGHEELLSFVEHDRHTAYDLDTSSKTFTLSLFSKGNFRATFHDDVPLAKMVDLIKGIETDTRHNYIIANEQQKQFGRGLDLDSEKVDARTYLPRPFNTSALNAVFDHMTHLAIGQVGDLGPGYGEIMVAAKSQLMDAAQGYLFTAYPSTQSNHVVLEFRDEKSSIYDVTLERTLSLPQMNHLMEALQAEVSQNFELNREHDPKIKALAERRANLPSFDEMFPPDPELKAYLKETLDDDIDYQQAMGNQERVEELVAQEVSENVVSPRFRR